MLFCQHKWTQMAFLSWPGIVKLQQQQQPAAVAATSISLLSTLDCCRKLKNIVAVLGACLKVDTAQWQETAAAAADAAPCQHLRSLLVMMDCAQCVLSSHALTATAKKSLRSRCLRRPKTILCFIHSHSPPSRSISISTICSHSHFSTSKLFVWFCMATTITHTAYPAPPTTPMYMVGHIRCKLYGLPADKRTISSSSEGSYLLQRH